MLVMVMVMVVLVSVAKVTKHHKALEQRGERERESIAQGN
jgi:hypothetical protein